MLIDCDSCAVRGAACAGCVVNVLIETPREVAGLTADEVAAVEVFARAGLELQLLAAPEQTRPLRLVPAPRRRRGAA